MTYKERNYIIRRDWKAGKNTWEIAKALDLPEALVEHVVFDFLTSRKKRAAA